MLGNNTLDNTTINAFRAVMLDVQRIDFSSNKIKVNVLGKTKVITRPTLLFGVWRSKAHFPPVTYTDLKFYELYPRSPSSGMADWYNDLLSMVEDYANCSIEEFTNGHFKYITENEVNAAFSQMLGLT